MTITKKKTTRRRKPKIVIAFRWIYHRLTFHDTRKLITKTLGDMFTNWNGDVDPARLIGYGWVLIFGILFLILTVYDTIKNHTFNSMAFSGGGVAIAAQILTAAVGVRIKQPSETPFPPEPEPIVVEPEPGPPIGPEGPGSTPGPSSILSS